jgi:hypothetical protein
MRSGKMIASGIKKEAMRTATPTPWWCDVNAQAQIAPIVKPNAIVG